MKSLVSIGAKIRHKEHTCLIGEIAAHDISNYPKVYRISWNEPWFAASIIDKPEDFLFLSDEEFEVLDNNFKLLVRNQVCPTCNGAKGFKVLSKTEQFYHGPWRVCRTCNGTGKVFSKEILR